MAETEVITDTKTKVVVVPPSMYNVILHNDNQTTIDFVIMILMNIFYKTIEEANELTLKIHETGQGIAGTYSYEVATQKRDDTLVISRQNNFPLQCTVSKE